MKHSFSLIQKFSVLLVMFAGLLIAVLYLLVTAKNEPIDFGKQELVGDVYQRPLEKAFKGLAYHRILAQRALYGDKPSQAALGDIAKSIDAAITEIEKTDAEIGEVLQFTEKGLHSRKRDHFTIANIAKEWADLKGKLQGLKPAESNDLHAHLIGDIRGMIAHLGDTSNLILDPDLDSYYLMDVTLAALPQSQERIQNMIVELEPIVRKKLVTAEDRLKASVFASMMSEADLERIKGDFQTVLNEDPNFYGKSPTLESKLAPENTKFANSYKDLIDIATAIGTGTPPTLENFLKVSDRALEQSFSYWEAGVVELDKLLGIRVNFIEASKLRAMLISIASLLIFLTAAALFVRSLVRTMRELATTLNRSSAQVANASSQSAATSSSLSEAATQQAASLQQTMASLEQISAMVSQNADSANRTRDVVDANQKVAEDGSHSVNEMLGAIQEIKSTNDEILTQMETSNKEFGEIVKIISEIGEKTTVINEIVFQTKLLSFNASVEAARAGEHGKGFAVVAEEVGNLAQMSGNAAKEITDMLSVSIKKVNEIVERTRQRVDQLVEVGKDKISMGQMTAQKCREALNKITGNAKSIASMIAEITHASKEQAQGVEEINKAIGQLDQVTQQNSAAAQQSSQQADQLSSEAQVFSSAVTELIVFVEGHRKEFNVVVAEKPKSKSAEAKNHSVVPFARAQNKKKLSAKPKSEPVLNKAVGSRTPLNSDPNFEEF
jgi:methyl-accepting chemotaxis protein